MLIDGGHAPRLLFPHSFYFTSKTTMLANESKARATYVAANRNLEAALATYADARNNLHKITGEFTGTDQKLTLKFSTTDGANRSADVVLTDC